MARPPSLPSDKVSLENVMKRLILVVTAVLATAALSGCPHPNDITDDDVSAIAAPAAAA
jgi:hypothetical protein